MLNRSKVWLWLAGCMAAVIGVFFGAPISLAAGSTIGNLSVLPDPFHIQIPGDVNNAQLHIVYDWDAGGYGSADVTEVIKDASGNVVYFWGANVGADSRKDSTPNVSEKIYLLWDGKANNGEWKDKYVPDGSYTFEAISHVAAGLQDADASKTFMLTTTTAPEVSWDVRPASVYYMNSGKYGVNFNLVLNTAKSAVVKFTVHGTANSGLPDEVISVPESADGNYDLSWDGTFNGVTPPNGLYTYDLQAEGNVDGVAAVSNKLSGQFTVKFGEDPKPGLSNLAIVPSPYYLSSGTLHINYNLSSSVGDTTVQAAIFKVKDKVNPIISWASYDQGSGDASFSWNGLDKDGKQAPGGTYVVKIWGSDGNYQLPPIWSSFIYLTLPIQIEQQTQDKAKCSGFVDITFDDPGCDAITFAKNRGIMTGNDNGKFDGDSNLQRDQMAKIILTAKNAFSKEADYCNGDDPFPDVPTYTWSYQYICRGINLGLITGYKSGPDNGFYRPGRVVSRVEFLALLIRSSGLPIPDASIPSYDDVPVNQWYSGFARFAMNSDFFDGPNLHPDQAITRREAAEVIYAFHLQGNI